MALETSHTPDLFRRFARARSGCLIVWMRDLLGMSNDLEGWRQSVCIGRLVAPDALLRVDPVQHQMVTGRGAQLVRQRDLCSLLVDECQRGRGHRQPVRRLAGHSG
jgi:hypothetical protein